MRFASSSSMRIIALHREALSRSTTGRGTSGHLPAHQIKRRLINVFLRQTQRDRTHNIIEEYCDSLTLDEDFEAVESHAEG